MFLEQRSISPGFSLIKDRLNTSSVVEIAGFFNNALEEKHLKNPNLSPYALFKSIVGSNLPLRVSNVDSIRQKALEAMTSEDERMKLAGTNAFLWLSMRTILKAVDSTFITEEDTDEDREEMFSSAIASVMYDASDLRGKDQISAKVSGRAKAGILSYFRKKYDMSFDVSNLTSAREISLIRSISDLRNMKGLTNKEMQVFARELSVETGIPFTNIWVHLIKEQQPLVMEEEIEDPKRSDPYDNVGLRIDMKPTLDAVFAGYKSESGKLIKKVLELKYRLSDKDGDGVERTDDEVGKELGISGSSVSVIRKKAIRKLINRYYFVKRRLQEYLG